MTNRLDAVMVRKYTKDGEERSSFKNIGVAFLNKAGWSVKLEAMPAPDAEGYFNILLFEPKAKEGGYQKPERAFGASDGLDDKIPF